MLIGTSGSGKSTTLKMINQLVEQDSGVIRFAGEDIRRQPLLALRRRMGYAIQSIGLFPHWTVAQNIATVPQLQKWPRAKITERVDELMALLGWSLYYAIATRISFPGPAAARRRGAGAGGQPGGAVNG